MSTRVEAEPQRAVFEAEATVPKHDSPKTLADGYNRLRLKVTLIYENVGFKINLS